MSRCRCNCSPLCYSGTLYIPCEIIDLDSVIIRLSFGVMIWLSFGYVSVNIRLCFGFISEEWKDESLITHDKNNNRNKKSSVGSYFGPNLILKPPLVTRSISDKFKLDIITCRRHGEGLPVNSHRPDNVIIKLVVT